MSSFFAVTFLTFHQNFASLGVKLLLGVRFTFLGDTMLDLETEGVLGGVISLKLGL